MYVGSFEHMKYNALCELAWIVMWWEYEWELWLMLWMRNEMIYAYKYIMKI